MSDVEVDILEEAAFVNFEKMLDVEGETCRSIVTIDMHTSTADMTQVSACLNNLVRNYQMTI